MAAKFACALGALLCAFLQCDTAEAGMGSLAPHDVAASASAEQHWLADQRTGCRALDPGYMVGDGITWQGPCIADMASGSGTLTFLNAGRVTETIRGTFGEGAMMPGHASAVWSNGEQYEGGQLAGQFDGPGRFVSAKGDRIDGQWEMGALNGKASIVWANGDRYDGNWTNGEANGEGTEVWVNGDRYQGLWRNGKPQGTREAHDPAPTPGAAAAVDTGSTPVNVPQSASPDAISGMQTDAAQSAAQFGGASNPLHGLTDQNLVAVDGSVLSLNPVEGGLTRTVSISGGPEEQLTFAFMNDRIGTVSDASSSIGVFRTTSEEIDTDFANGNTETMKRAPGPGLLIVLHAPDGGSTCTAWYPEGHLFTQEQKKIAVQEYARRLGISDAIQPKKHRALQAGDQPCGGAFLTDASSADVGLSRWSVTKTDAGAVPRLQSVPGSSDSIRPAQVAATGGLQNVAVRDAPVHMIDAQFDRGAIQQATVQNVKFTPESISPPSPVPAPHTGDPDGISPTDATQCLSIGSDGAYWGFRNHCAKAVQFAYCEKSDLNPLTSCAHTTVSGSVAASGFSPLVSDKSLSEQSVDHGFRWMACAGGAGEVVARLDSVEPPGGRCMRAIPSAPASSAGS